MGILQEDEDEAFHSAKKLAVELTRQVCADLARASDVSYLSPGTRENLVKTRELFVEIQHRLRDCITRRLAGIHRQ